MIMNAGVMKIDEMRRKIDDEILPELDICIGEFTKILEQFKQLTEEEKHKAEQEDDDY
jgi:hypothetical protein